MGILVAVIREGDTDSLPAYKITSVRKCLETAGARPLYLPPYSSDLDLIKLEFVKLKAIL